LAEAGRGGSPTCRCKPDTIGRGTGPLKPTSAIEGAARRVGIAASTLIACADPDARQGAF
jgi:hypothetical protein